MTRVVSCTMARGDAGDQVLRCVRKVRNRHRLKSLRDLLINLLIDWLQSEVSSAALSAMGIASDHYPTNAVTPNVQGAAMDQPIVTVG